MLGLTGDGVRDEVWGTGWNGGTLALVVGHVAGPSELECPDSVDSGRCSRTS